MTGPTTIAGCSPNGLFRRILRHRHEHNAQFKVIEESEQRQSQNIPQSSDVRLLRIGAQEKPPASAARVTVVRSDSGDILVFMIRNHSLGASITASIYKDRWQLELSSRRYATEDQDLRQHRGEHTQDADVDRIDLSCSCCVTAQRFPVSGGA